MQVQLPFVETRLPFLPCQQEFSCQWASTFSQFCISRIEADRKGRVSMKGNCWLMWCGDLPSSFHMLRSLIVSDKPSGSNRRGRGVTTLRGLSKPCLYRTCWRQSYTRCPNLKQRKRVCGGAVIARVDPLRGSDLAPSLPHSPLIPPNPTGCCCYSGNTSWMNPPPHALSSSLSRLTFCFVFENVLALPDVIRSTSPKSKLAWTWTSVSMPMSIVTSPFVCMCGSYLAI